jgi:hypothetical protein
MSVIIKNSFVELAAILLLVCYNKLMHAVAMF